MNITVSVNVTPPMVTTAPELATGAVRSALSASRHEIPDAFIFVNEARTKSFSANVPWKFGQLIGPLVALAAGVSAELVTSAKPTTESSDIRVWSCCPSC